MKAEIDAAVRVLGRGGIAIVPTETVYGLAADAANPEAVARIFEAKGRPRFNPLIAHVADLEAALRVADIADVGLALAEAFWPGPLTLVAPARSEGGVCDLARAGLDSVAVRAPAHPVAQSLLTAFGRPLVAPSANRSGRPSPTTFADAMEETGPAAAAALDGGACEVGVESTVVSLLGPRPALLRAGGVAREDIVRVAGRLEEAPHEAIRSPGRLTLHYAPDAPVRLEAAEPAAGEAFLAFGPGPASEWTLNLSPRGDLREAAANLFAAVRALDRLRPSAIAVASIPDHGLGEAINDRLRRAAGLVG